MTKQEALKARHAVRNYIDKPIEKEVITKLEEEIKQCNEMGNLHIQLITNNKEAFNSLIPTLGRFKNVRNYIALVGKVQENGYESCGYYGARIMITAQQLGLNSCWVTSTYNKKKCPVALAADEELIGVIAIGYGVTNGSAHKSKKLESLCEQCEKEWFLKGMEAACLAPTGLNKQNFMIKTDGHTVSACTTANRIMSKIDLGIVKYHFEIGAGIENFMWK